MKTRTGFVSNSSSSSFIIALPRRPNSANDLRHMLFDSSTTILDYEYADEDIPVELVAEQVYRQIENKEPNNLEEIREKFKSWTNYDLSARFFTYMRGRQFSLSDPIYRKYEQEEDKKRNELRQQFLYENSGKSIYVVEFSDNDGSLNTAIEHGPTFDNIPYFCISKH
jgi:hypothetical protein